MICLSLDYSETEPERKLSTQVVYLGKEAKKQERGAGMESWERGLYKMHCGEETASGPSEQ